MLTQTISRLDEFARLLHGFSTRLGGVSQPPHASLNLAFSRPDDPAAVLENRRRFAAALGFSLDNVVITDDEGVYVYCSPFIMVESSGGRLHDSYTAHCELLWYRGYVVWSACVAA